MNELEVLEEIYKDEEIDMLSRIQAQEQYLLIQLEQQKQQNYGV
jgi:hypothetical protein